jgi:hypothetical protein
MESGKAGSLVKLRFVWDVDHWIVKARRKSTGKWEVLGTCHASAKEQVKAGRFELLRLATERQAA